MLAIDNLETEYEAWRERRQQELSAPESWFGLIGLDWLEPGLNGVGSAPECAVRLPEDAPPHLGDLWWDGPRLTWRPAPAIVTTLDGVAVEAERTVTLNTDALGSPSRVAWGELAFTVIEREGRLAVRLRDLSWRIKRPFAGLACYDLDPAWRVEACWETLSEPLALEVQSVTGGMKPITVTARAVFQVNGVDAALLPLEVTKEGAFFIFRDATSGRETYGGGRFLQAGVPSGGRLILDFNRAFNPPCAFTDFATCSLPPPENWLPFPVRAGEKKYA